MYVFQAANAAITYTTMNLSLLSAILVGILNKVAGQFETSQMISLLESANDTLNTMTSILPHVENSLKNQDLNQTAILLSQRLSKWRQCIVKKAESFFFCC